MTKAENAPPSASDHALEPAAPDIEKYCTKIVTDLGKNAHLYRSWRREGKYITVEVRDTYYFMDFAKKAQFDSMLRCAASEGRVKEQGLSLVEYLDARTHKNVATWSPELGFNMEN